MAATLMTLTLVLPNFTTSMPGPAYSLTQLAFIAGFSLLLYLAFVFVQTVQNRDYFLPKGDLAKAISQAGAIIDGAKKKKGRKH